MTHTIEQGQLFRQLIDANTPTALWRVADVIANLRAEKYGGHDPSSVLYLAESVVLFGAGAYARVVLRSWADKMPRIRCLVDSNPTKWGTMWCGLPVLSPAELSSSLANSLVVVAAMDTHTIEEKLESLGITPLFAEHDGSVGYLPGSWLTQHQMGFADVFECLADDMSRYVYLEVSKARLFQRFNFPMKGNWFTAECSTQPQYFPAGIVELAGNESFLDCGAFDGDTVIDFASQMWRKNIKRWYAIALEADAKNAIQARNNLDAFGLNDVPVLHRVLGANPDNPFVHNCRDIDHSQQGIQISLDDIPWKMPPTYIKMDIEGAELDAIKSCERTLSRYLPKLAICLYHRTSDLLEIPLHIRKTHPSYKLYTRHHRAGSLWETVCYAIPS